MTPREAAAKAEYWEKVWEWFAIVLGSLLLWLGTSDVLGKGPDTAWTKFVQVEGQPEPVPEQWVSTPEGRFAHSIRIPNPVPKDSGYRRGMSSEEYFRHLCQTEAGEFIFKTVENVEGFYFMRPPKAPTDDDLKDRYRLEAPEIERTFQLLRESPTERAQSFVNPPWAIYRYVEEPQSDRGAAHAFVRASGHRQRVTPMNVDAVPSIVSQYGLIWRGLRRTADRDLAIAGSEWIVVDLATRQVLAIQREFARTGRTRNAPEGIWWLNAINCPNSTSKNIFLSRVYKFVAKVLRPIPEKNYE